jgi:hypothetical protein
MRDKMQEVLRLIRFNRRRTRHAAFRSILAIGIAITPATYKMLIAPETRG